MGTSLANCSWTDGLLWSPSRIKGNFLCYRELDQKTKNRAVTGYHEYIDDSGNRAASGSKGTMVFKSGGLVKKTISLNVGSSTYHLVSYYRKDDVFKKRQAFPC